MSLSFVVSYIWYIPSVFFFLLFNVLCSRVSGASLHFFLCIFLAILLSSPFFSITLLYIDSRNSGPGSHSGRFFPVATTVGALYFVARKKLLFSSLVDSRRIMPTRTRAMRSKLSAVDPFYLFIFCTICSKWHTTTARFELIQDRQQ